MDKELDFYQKLRQKIREWLQTEEGKNTKYAEYLMLAPDLFYLLCKLAFDKDVAVAAKANLAGAIAYFVSPIDLIPEGIVGPVGFLDDIVVSVWVLNGIINNTDPAIISKHWPGDEDLLEIVQQILGVADEMLGAGVFKKIKNMF
ncbi:MAG: hypothetical protein BWX76_00008 [Candidatus Cloacimonetes bacterium ADurb.Bin089]|nr:MAG: hypothetical protein BWX76_00008 [Candidatus Cloacimonetes bacterium ADurb.Bin089]